MPDFPGSADDPDARLHDAIMSAAARDQTAQETGKHRDALRFITALARVMWWLRRSEKAAKDGPAPR